MPNVSTERVKEVLQKYFQTGQTNLTPDALSRYKRVAKTRVPEWYQQFENCEQNSKNGAGKEELEVLGDNVTWKLITRNKPLSIDDIFEEFKLRATVSINIDDYEVDRFKVESWDVTAFEQGVATTVKNYLTDVRFRKKRPEALAYEEDKKQALELCKKYSPRFPALKKQKRKSDKLLELGIYDPHYGKLSIIDKTGETGTLKGASVMVRNAVVDLVSRTKGYDIEEVVFPIGNDFLHINNSGGETSNGTQMEYTNYFYQIKRKCKEDLIWCVEYLRKNVAPVRIIQVPGNHDEDAILSIAEILDAYFHKNKDVDVDISPKLRKHITYGRNFIGFLHGDPRDVKHDRLPLVFASEHKQEWAECEYHEIHLGHIHFKRDMTFVIGDEFSGCRLRWIPSLASADSWHYRKGFVKTRKAAEAFIWDKEEGLIGNFSVNVRMS